MKSPLKASIVIPVYNAEKTIIACLNSILAEKTSDYEVIVVDDGSTDETASLISRFSCRVITLNQNMGRGYARNRGVEAAQAPYVLLTDADCIVSENWISIAVKEFDALTKRDNSIVGAVGRILPMKGFFNRCDAYSSYGYNQNITPAYIDNFCTSNLIVKREIVLEVGSFDESLRTFEDLDLGLRIVQNGGRLYYQPKMAVHHNHTRLGFRGFLAHEYEWGCHVGNYFDLKYPSYHWTPINRWMGNVFVYAISAPIFALLITLKIIATNIRFDPSVVLIAPFIFASKMLFRCGALKYMARQTAPNGTFEDLKSF